MSRDSDNDVRPPAPPISAAAARLGDALRQTARTKIRLEELWPAWAAANPQQTARPEMRRLLAEAITELASAGEIVVSAKLDTTALPHLPTQVRLPAGKRSQRGSDAARRTAWRPELAWVLRTRLSVRQVEQLRRINLWLRDHAHEEDTLPLRERSLEILGDEKALDRMLTTDVFGAARLSLAQLRTFRTHPPLAATRIGAGPVLLVVENDDTFHSISRALVQARDRGLRVPVGYVAWGAGGAFEASVRSAGDLPGINRVRYFGDIDPDGLRIPRSAAVIAEREELPPVLPAYELYRMLLRTGVRISTARSVDSTVADELVSWIGDDFISSDISGLFTTGYRIPQEALRATVLSTDLRWFNDL